MSDFEVIFYTRHDGGKPAKDFILGLDKKMRTKMLRTIEILEDKGNNLREPYSKHLDDGIFELRAKVGSDISRVLYFFVVNHEIIRPLFQFCRRQNFLLAFQRGGRY